MKKRSKGITLISLAITIAVLIILAGVSVSAILGDDGIIKRAQESADLTKKSESKEIINRAVLEFRLTEGYDTLEDFLKTKIPNKIDNVINNGDGTLTIEKDGYSVTVKNTTQKDNSSKGDNTIDDVKPEPEPTLTIEAVKVVANNDGTGDALGEASTALGKTLYITFSHSIEGGTTTVEPPIPYAVKENKTYSFTVTGTVDGKTYTKDVSVTVNQFKGTNDYVADNIEVTYPDGKVWVPEGFKIADDSSEDIQGGVVIEDKDGNQFVWIPVNSIDDYKRTWYKGDDIYLSFSSYSESLPDDEKNSVTTYKGFYIGRYESGDKESTEAKTLRSSNDVTKTVTIKANQAPYNYVTRTQAVSLAEGFATKQGYKAKTKLVSSYAYDTTIAFIEKTVNNYGSSSEEGNYKDTTFSYTEITDESKPEKTKAKNSPLLVATGQTTPVCNIYDMGGNVFEWTTESCSYTTSPSAQRGGYYLDGFADYPAGYRVGSSADAYDGNGFRLTLFM